MGVRTITPGFSLPESVPNVRLEDFACLGIPWPSKSEFTVCLAQPQEKRRRVPLLAQPAQPSLEYSQ